jgi:hypothetical protein
MKRATVARFEGSEIGIDFANFAGNLICSRANSVGTLEGVHCDRSCHENDATEFRRNGFDSCDGKGVFAEGSALSDEIDRSC